MHHPETTLPLFAAVAALVFGLSAPGAKAEEYVVDVRIAAPEEITLTVPLDKNNEVHKGFDATVRHPMEFEDGEPVGYDECGIGLALELTDFSCDGDVVKCKIELEIARLSGWNSQYPVGLYRGPVFQTYAIHTEPISARLGEWLTEERWCTNAPNAPDFHTYAIHNEPISSKLGEWLIDERWHTNAPDAPDFEKPFIRIRKADTPPPEPAE